MSHELPHIANGSDSGLYDDLPPDLRYHGPHPLTLKKIKGSTFTSRPPKLPLPIHRPRQHSSKGSPAALNLPRSFNHITPHKSPPQSLNVVSKPSLDRVSEPPSVRNDNAPNTKPGGPTPTRTSSDSCRQKQLEHEPPSRPQQQVFNSSLDDGPQPSSPRSSEAEENIEDMISSYDKLGDERVSYASDVSDEVDDEVVRAELPHKWIPTLSMRFRDGTKREKFFVTYIKHPNHWLRVSISVNYENAEDGSLEQDLETLAYQRDKNFCIYKAVRQSLDEISWFDTVTNLRLETEEERLHIHVAEDANEKIQYPAVKILSHIHLSFHGYLEVDERDVHFLSHLSGFVYKVEVHGHTYVKKEITSTDTVQEFIYEIEALAALRESHSVINLVGIVKSDLDGVPCVTGVLIEWARLGALNDFFYDYGDDDLTWDTRLSWIRQVVRGIADIHEAGFVQGDCTLSNVVLDADGNAKIVDINRRGCPIGWEPPEFRGMIQSGQRISMYIGVKSDLFQMGMVLWAIATQIEEPDRAERPLTLDDPSTPPQLREVIASCLAESPIDRKSAKELLAILPAVEGKIELPTLRCNQPIVPTLKDITSGLPTLEEIQKSQEEFYCAQHESSHSLPDRSEREVGPIKVYDLQANDLAGLGLFGDSQDVPILARELSFGPRSDSPISHFSVVDHETLFEDNGCQSRQCNNPDREDSGCPDNEWGPGPLRKPLHQDSGVGLDSPLENNVKGMPLGG